jgi:hypothetical protein
MLRSGEIIRDSRVVYVQPKEDLKIEVKTDKDVHLPGENGRIYFRVTDGSGKPTVAALGVIIVDEAVYALQEMQPGLEKVYFTLQEELLKPQVQVNFKPNESVENLIRQPAVQAAKQQVAQVLLTAVRPKAPAHWEVAPAVERRRKMDNQITQIGWALYNYASQFKPFLQYDKAAKKWDFRPELLQEVVKANYLQQSMLDDPLGGTLTLEALAGAEKQFTADRLAQVVNSVRMYQVLTTLVYHSNLNQNKWLKKGKWTFPKTALADALKPGWYGYNQNWLKDVWGNEYKLVELQKKQANKTGHSQFDFHQLVSAGPDGKFGTKDDITEGDLNVQTYYAGLWWWSRDGAQLARLQQNWNWGGRHRLRGMMDEFLMEKEAAAVNRFALPTGGMLPLAARSNSDNKKDAKPGQTGPVPGGGGPAPPVRVREYFPETLRWEPEIITDEQGRATVALTYADSITTWRLSASAHSQRGLLGGVSAPLRVFQDFFVDLDLPVSLTQNDEVAFPVAVYNYLKTPQTVKLRLKKEPWFELLDSGGYTRSLDLQPNEVTAVKFRIKAQRIGFHPLEVKAFGSKLSDAIKRTIEVVPDGKKIEQVVSDRLAGKVTQTITIPDHALPDASKLVVKLYPGVMSQVLEGVEGMLRLPGG